MSQCGSPSPAPLCPGAFSVPTTAGGIRGKLWGFWPKIHGEKEQHPTLQSPLGKGDFLQGIFSGDVGWQRFPSPGQRGSSRSCSRAVLSHALANSTDKPVLRGRTLFQQ